MSQTYAVCLLELLCCCGLTSYVFFGVEFELISELVPSLESGRAYLILCRAKLKFAQLGLGSICVQP